MADEGRDRRERRRQRPSVELTNTPFALAADDTYSTTLRAFARGDWEGEIPEAIFYVDGERLGRAVPVQDRYATKAITGLGPDHHYLAEVAIGGQRAERLLMIPELPKQKTAEAEALEREKLELERTKITAELEKLRKRPDSNEKRLAAARLRLELARIDAELKKLSATPSDAEQNVAEARLKLELARITAELEKLGAQPSSQERQLAETKLRLEQARIEKELAELQRQPSQAEQEIKEHRLELERAKIDAELTKLRAEPSSLEKQLAEAKLRRELEQVEQELADIGKQPERHPTKLSVEPLGFKPNLRFVIHLTDQEGRGTAGRVEASTYADSNFFEIIEVDSSGSAIWPPRDKTAIRFRDRLRTYQFRIVGADLKDGECACECVVS